MIQKRGARQCVEVAELWVGKDPGSAEEGPSLTGHKPRSSCTALLSIKGPKLFYLCRSPAPSDQTNCGKDPAFDHAELSMQSHVLLLSVL